MGHYEEIRQGSSRDRFRCKATIKSRRCWFNTQVDDEYCPGHQDDPHGECDMAALGRYQAKHGVDYPCGKADDLERVFEPKDYHFKGGVPVPITEEDRHPGLKACDDALDAHAEKRGVPALADSDYIDGAVRLSNKGCPRYYGTPADLDSDLPSSPPKRCGCPKGACWYDVQLKRRSRSQRALRLEAWLALHEGRVQERDRGDEPTVRTTPPKKRGKKPRSVE